MNARNSAKSRGKWFSCNILKVPAALSRRQEHTIRDRNVPGGTTQDSTSSPSDKFRPAPYFDE